MNVGLFDSPIGANTSHNRLRRLTLTLISPSFRLIWATLRIYLDMALVDFYQLAVLYKLRRPDAGFLPIHSHSFSMSDTSSSPSPPPPSSPVELDHVHPPLPPTQPGPKTPERKPGAARSLQPEGVTPLSRGSSIRQRQEGDTDRGDKYTRGDYEPYIRED